jgi:hypothetical protein
MKLEVLFHEQEEAKMLTVDHAIDLYRLKKRAVSGLGIDCG